MHSIAIKEQPDSYIAKCHKEAECERIEAAKTHVSHTV